MRLHADLGDRAAALQVYQRLAECLRDELDVVPSEAVRQFAQNLRQAAGHAGSPPAVAAAASTPLASLPGDGGGAAQALPPVVPFVARAAAQQRIEAAWARGQRVYLHGAPGAGKTRLASELAAARGPWLRVACEPQDGELPYASVVRVLRALRASAPDVAAARLGAARTRPADAGTRRAAAGRVDRRCAPTPARRRRRGLEPADARQLQRPGARRLALGRPRQRDPVVAPRRRLGHAGGGLDHRVPQRPAAARGARASARRPRQPARRGRRARGHGRRRGACPHPRALGRAGRAAVLAAAAPRHRRQPVLPARDAAPPVRAGAADGGRRRLEHAVRRAHAGLRRAAGAGERARHRAGAGPWARRATAAAARDRQPGQRRHRCPPARGDERHGRGGRDRGARARRPRPSSSRRPAVAGVSPTTSCASR